MKDTKLYEQILGLEAPWSVQSVTLKKEAGEIEIEVTCAETVWACPECGQRAAVYTSGDIWIVPMAKGGGAR